MSKSTGTRLLTKFLTTILSLFVLAIAAGERALAMMPTVKLGNEEVRLEVAQTPQEVQKGLMFRTSLPETQGMVFLFHPTNTVAFWMYHCHFPLDMIFVKDGKIQKIAKMVPPCKSEDPKKCPTYPESGQIEVSEVIEVNGGFCDRHGVKEGDSVSFNFPK